LEHADNPVYKARYQDLYDTYGMKMLAVCGSYGCDPLQPQNGSLHRKFPGKLPLPQNWWVETGA
jgi:hypothetical protein